MLKTKHLLAIFIPAIFIGIFALFIRFIQYAPLLPDEKEYEKFQTTQFNIPLDQDDPVIGDKKAPITLVAFEDFGCPACQAQTKILEQVMQKHPKKIKIIWKGLPVTRFPQSTELAQDYGFCFNQQGKFQQFYPLAFTNGEKLSTEILKLIASQIKADEKKLEECLNSSAPKIYRQKNEQLAAALNIQSVPTIFLNNKQIQPPQILEGWETLLGL